MNLDSEKELDVAQNHLLLMDGFALREAAHLLKMPRAVAVSCMENFCYRARAVIG